MQWWEIGNLSAYERAAGVVHIISEEAECSDDDTGDQPGA